MENHWNTQILLILHPVMATVGKDRNSPIPESRMLDMNAVGIGIAIQIGLTTHTARAYKSGPIHQFMPLIEGPWNG